MDEELEVYLDAMRREINDGQERLLSRLAASQRDFLNTKGFLVNNTIVSGRCWLDLGERVARLERDQRNGP